MGVSGDKIKSNEICVFTPRTFRARHGMACARVLQSLLLCRMCVTESAPVPYAWLALR